jgi:acetoacetyl-CoA synthetase
MTAAGTSIAVPAWTPSAERVERATIRRFAAWVQDRVGVRVTESYDQLWRWSVDDVDGFWSAVWDYFDVQADGRAEPVLGSRSMPGAEWFPNARLNYAEHVFRDRDPDALAIQYVAECDTAVQAWSWARLEDETARIATGLRCLGVRRGDRVAAYLTNAPETVAAFLACASIGAIWSSAAPEFGLSAVIDRFMQIEPKVLLAIDGYTYGGKEVDRRAVVAQLRAALPTVEHLVVLEQLGRGPVPDALRWDDLIASHEPLRCSRVRFDHPLWILYSSGTTGLPKPIVHSQGGVLLEQLKVLHLHLDAQAGDRVFWFTTTGWMMWNFLVGVLLTPASIVLYDGNPATPTLDRLWGLAQDAGVTCFGTSAAYIAACMKEGVEPGAGRDLSMLQAVGSTGSPLSPEGFQWVYDHVGSDTWLFSTSGGTDMCTAFVGGVPTLPVHRGELQARALGARVESWDPDGKALTGGVGELVITEPMPSMPIFLWGDDKQQTRLREAYFDHYAGVWRHGDWIEITERGTAIIYGRSDSTINRGGVRMGTSEIYRAVLADEDLVDALVVDVPREGTEGGCRRSWSCVKGSRWTTT